MSDARLSRAWQVVAGAVRLSSALAGLALGAMVAVTCADVLLRRIGMPFPGAFDLVRLCGVVALGLALPATTASKGHIAIEYFFHRLHRRGRWIVDGLLHSLMILSLTVAAHQCGRAAIGLRAAGEVTPTLEVPLHWFLWVMAAGCFLAALTSLYHLVHPGQEMPQS